MDNSVKYRQKLFEDFEESLFRLAVFDASEQEGECAGAEMTESELERPSELQLARFTKTVRRHRTANAPRQSRRKRINRQLAASAAVLLLVFLVSVFTVDAFRLEVLNFLLRMESEYTFVRLEDPEPDTGWTGGMPAYVPEGYEVESMASTGAFKRIIYTMPADGDKLIVFSEYEDSNGVNIDSEDADYIGNVSVSGSEATLTTKNGLNNIVWTAGNRFYHLYGTLTAEEIVRMAESVES